MKKTQRKIISVSYLYMWYRFMLIYINFNFDFLGLKADFQSSHEAPRSSLRVLVSEVKLTVQHCDWMKVLMHALAASSFVRGLEIRL